MNTPDWYRQAVADHGARVLGGSENRAAACAAVAMAIQAHPEFAADLAAAMADRDIARWVREHESSGDLFQTALFPLMPASMRTTPAKSVKVADMTGPDLDNAKAMLWNRTKNQMEGAEEAANRERAAFSRFYDQVRPLLTGDLTVADVLGRLAAQPAPDGKASAA